MRLCKECRECIPPETEHYVYKNDPYCTGCIDATPYTAYLYEVNGHYIGNSEDGEVEFVESYDDYYEVVSE
ncbi:hypothetical protein [Sporosarcina newyorkensis]|uniref:hypothetical protein n=1 Tax=Sporosarcina newyorkensis TaxID=759851 RepID=UPI0005927668|nr:hypothetical protein [Sporosarcina newyorkensis]